MGKIGKDIILISGIVFIAFLFWLVPFSVNGKREMGCGKVRVFQDGKEVGVYDIGKEQTVLFSYGEEHYNLMVIEDGKVSVREADCPDGLCVRQGGIVRNGESIICLPHKLVIRVESDKEGAPDAVTY